MTDRPHPNPTGSPCPSCGYLLTHDGLCTRIRCSWVAIDLDLLTTLHEKCAGRVKYKLGEKAMSLDCDSSLIKRIDCSGYVRWLVYRAAKGSLILPDGSQTQLQFCARVGWRELAQYSDVAYATEDPSRLFIAFLAPKPGKAWPRHVWLVRSGMTMESCGSAGVTSRPWNHRAIQGSQCCFEVPVR